MREKKRFAKVTGLHHDGETYTHVYDIGQRLTFLESYMFGEERVYDFKDEQGLRQTLFRDQFEWEEVQ